jgi:imidazolonepropionase-like amidohydrolase
VLYIPGSGSNMGGFGAIFKTGPGTLDDVLVRFPGALKIAQAGNPERRGSGELGSGRQGMNWNIRETLLQGKRYNDAWLAYERGDSAEPPKVDLRLENLRKLFNKEIPVVVHTQIYQVVMMTVSMLHDELDLNVVIDHGTFDGYKLAPEMAKRGIPAMLGPRGIYYDREVGQIFGIPAMYYQGGVMAVGVNTDSPVIPQEDLVFQAAMAVHFGLPEDVALRGLTIEAAKALMIDDRVGSLEVGKDADIIIRNGPPIDIRSRVEQAFIDGRLIYDITRERQIY